MQLFYLFHFYLLLIITNLCCSIRAKQRPFYNIAHMANSIMLIDYFLDRGANAIEADVNFKKNGTAVYMYHGVPCDCFRDCKHIERVERYLIYARDLANPEHKRYKETFALLMLDLKTSDIESKFKFKAGEQFADMIIKYVFENGRTLSKLKLQISVERVDDMNFIKGFNQRLNGKQMQHLNKRIGWDISLHEPLEKIAQLWSSMDEMGNIWQGDGISNCLSPFRKTERLRNAIKLENQCKERLERNCVRKVYQWTIDLRLKLRRSLRLGVDAIITNRPLRLKLVLREREFREKFRLATQMDDPWEPF
ncbi:dermonecrotic protein-like I [Dinothrombium tinctorium]|uniref:Dermonecrotic protein-like I n=1 Tax=Dinothrombium tinctorium TaxID=1965070 RepID=A0A3S4RGV0_9ACAR|nr:dermonecrotic protein-like I [Dinothrombium tinctorium]